LIRGLEDQEILNRFMKMGDVVVWKMPAFEGESDEFDRMVDDMVKGSALVLDLRGNGGGSRDLMERLVARFFDREVKIADVKGRKESKPSIARKRKGAAFAGKLAVLVDSSSGSAAEVFARVIQLEKRGTVVGDRSAGAVMQSESFDGSMGGESVIFYGASITNANVIMTDGKSLEHTGVMPDEVVLPTPEDIAGRRDPALARAVELVGGKLDAAQAGKAFPTGWK
jgi:C-terminal processing protease CtpA/Prc